MSAAHDSGAVRTWGSRPEERARDFPCDAQLPDATKTWHRAIDVDAPADRLFRWVCQLRAAPYSYDWLDNFGRRSPRELTPGLERLETGQTVMMFYELVDFEHDRQLTVVFRRFLWAFGQRAVTYSVEPDGEVGSRLVVRVRHRRPRGPYGTLMVGPMLPVIDLVMMRKQLRTLKKLAEAR